MKQLITSLSLVFILVIGCAQNSENSKNQEVIASKNGYQLTEEHFSKYLNALEAYELETGEIASKIVIKSELKQAFLEDPERILKELNALSESLDGRIDSRGSKSKNESETISTSHLAEGNRVVRQKLGNDIGQMQFNSQEANSFRIFLSNSLLSSRSNSFGSGGYRDSNANIQFCADGTFIQVLSGYVGIDVDGISGSSSGGGTDYMPGYWEVASLPNGMLIILFYSTHPSMLEDSPNGLLPFPVAEYTGNFVALPNGDGYRRTINYCK
jgi:hypothetical protein